MNILAQASGLRADRRGGRVSPHNHNIAYPSSCIDPPDLDLCPDSLATLEVVVEAGLGGGEADLADLFELLGELTRRQRGQFWGHLKRSRPDLAAALRDARATLGEVAA